MSGLRDMVNHSDEGLSRLGMAPGGGNFGSFIHTYLFCSMCFEHWSTGIVMKGCLICGFLISNLRNVIQSFFWNINA